MASNSSTESVASLLTVQSVIVLPLSTLTLMFITYGIYIIVFGLSIHVLTNRRDSKPLKLYLWCTTSLFALATFYVVTTAVAAFHDAITQFTILKTGGSEDSYLDYLNHGALRRVWFSVVGLVTILMNIIADGMLIHRCYIIWDSRKWVLYPLLVTTVAINGVLVATIIPAIFGFSNVDVHQELFQKTNNVNNIALLAAAIFNFILTLLTAGRIWWITREARKLMNRHVSTRYSAIVATIIESGLLYSTTLLVSIIIALVVDPNSEGKVPIDLGVLSAQLSGLAPTLIIVRVAYNKSVENVDQMVSTLNFVDPGPQRVSAATVDLRPRTPNYHDTENSSNSARTKGEKAV